jgi:hypothetical protein
MPASACPITATAAFVALLVIGCGTTTNGLEERSGTEVLDAATAAIDGASGVHVTGTGISGGRPAASPAGSCTRREVCGEYDEGGTVFRHGRRHRHPVPRHRREREQTQVLDCGFAASGGLIPLVDALNQGAEITMATS